MKCLHKKNAGGGFVGQHKRFCGLYECDDSAVAHVAVGAHWCANLCRKHATYYSKRPDTEVADTISIIEEGEESEQAKHKAIAAH